MTETEFQPGDAVHHGPTGEDWIVLRAGVDADGGFVEPAGWPPCRARASDCTMVKKGADARLAREGAGQ